MAHKLDEIRIDERSPDRGASLRRPALLAWLRMARVTSKLERSASEQTRANGLSLGQFDVLATVGAAPGLTQTELAERLLVTKGNVCQLLDRMERDGLLMRCAEGRANHLHLTERGTALFDRVVPEHEDLIARQLSCLTRDEQIQLHHLLRRVDSALR